MPIIVKAKNSDSTSDVIRKFKKVVSAADIVQKVKDRAYFTKPSQVKKVQKTQRKRLQKRLRSMKRMKNISADALERVAKQI